MTRAALRRSPPGSDLAAACLIAIARLGDSDPDVVPAIVPHLLTHEHHATNALLANGSPAADAELANILRSQPSLRLAVALVNVPRHRDAGVAAIRHLVSNEMRFRVEFGLANFVALVAPDVLPVLAEYPELFSLAEELGYSPYETFKITGEKPAALCIVGTKQPDAAVRIALSRLHDPDTPDGELYAPVVARFAKSDAVALLLDCVLRDPPTRVVESIGRELGHLDATAAVVDWLKSPAVENRLAACRVAGFLPHSEGLDAEVRGRADDTNRRIADAAVRSHERLQRSRTVDELLTAIAREADKTHRWVLLDAMVAVADPEGGTWTQAVRSTLSPAESRYLSERMKKRRKELTEELNREDR